METSPRTNWSSISHRRAEFYAWFSTVLVHELDAETVRRYQADEAAPLLATLAHIGLSAEAERLARSIRDWSRFAQSTLDLAADFAQLFLLDARQGASPYASTYLEGGQRLYGPTADIMCRSLAQSGLALRPDFKEPADHIAVYLALLERWTRQEAGATGKSRIAAAREQYRFISEAVLNWLPEFTERCQRAGATSDFYPAFAALTLAFVEEDTAYLWQIANPNISPSHH